ncbi:MgtC/SapB family protein [Flavobacterium lindanitolerans]|uniref:MgtC/SapB family protein n=1 Tax=Flavobacterium lindanitolerans TaxID=428988 RepID=UPI002809347A|nr:MgtC/SapB family protein [Flavobacterium lindanitolerans]MDQ7962008.1 MgtC/SapB family protein [Flavobacterium lindanitolerans]
MIAWYEIIARLLFAALLGGMIGFERERKDWAAGIRTHMIACMGSTLVMLVSCFGFSDILGYPNVELDPSRVASSVVIGIGYLGAGIILILKRGNIKGLTTASGLWATAAVGLSIGGGMYITGLVATIITVLILYVVQKLQNKKSQVREHRMTVRLYKKEEGTLLLEKLISYHLNFSLLAMEKKNKKYIVKARFVGAKTDVLHLTNELKLLPVVQKIRFK